MKDNIVPILIVEREGIKIKKVLYPRDIYDIPNLESISDLKIIENYAEKTLKDYKDTHIALYITGGLTVATLAALNVAYRSGITITAMHRDANTGEYFTQTLVMPNINFSYNNKNSVDLKVCNGRHFGVPGKEVFDLIPNNKILDMEWFQTHADSVLKDFKGQSVRLYITGLTQALFAILNAANKWNISVVAMHFNSMTDEYFAQEMFHKN